MRRSYDGDEAVNESYVVLTIGASLIATLGLLANNAAVVIGAMVVAPWILPLRALVFGSLIGDKKLLLRALLTLAIGVAITTLLSMGNCLVARTAIAVAVVPPVCLMGIMLAAGEFDDAQGAGLLFSANLL